MGDPALSRVIPTHSGASRLARGPLADRAIPVEEAWPGRFPAGRALDAQAGRGLAAALLPRSGGLEQLRQDRALRLASSLARDAQYFDGWRAGSAGALSSRRELP